MIPPDYIAEFPLPAAKIPKRLRTLLEPVGLSPLQSVEVSTRYDFDAHGPNREYTHMLMAVVPDGMTESTLNEAREGVIAFSVPDVDKLGGLREFAPSASGHDYIVASWGDGSFYSYNLADKVWMALGLTPRCIGSAAQRIIYDDLSLPEFGVAEGEISTEFYWSPKRDISWRMSNEYLRKYLWTRGAWGVRVFFYEVLLQDDADLRVLMNAQAHVQIRSPANWFELDLREFKGGILLQLWASIKAVSPQLCPEQSANGIIWPGIAGAMTHDRADRLVERAPVYLNDKFLERYEQSAFYNTTPANVFGAWRCSPSYRAQWSFTDCARVGRNLISVPIRELYKPKPDREIRHAHQFALRPEDVAHFNLDEEHIVSKVDRLLQQLLALGHHLSELAALVGINKSPIELSGFSKTELEANGWVAYPQLARLAQVAPLEMTQQAFLARCKALHEIWQKIPDGFIRRLLEKAGCPSIEIKKLGSLKLLQSLFNIVVQLNVKHDTADSFERDLEPDGWNKQNKTLAPLFLNNDLRIADAHEVITGGLQTLEELGFDTAQVNQGYGKALDFVFDGVIAAFESLNYELYELLSR